MSYADEVIRDAIATMPAEVLREVLLANLNADALRAILLAAVAYKLTGKVHAGPTVAMARSKASSKPAKASTAPAKGKATTGRAKGYRRRPEDMETMVAAVGSYIDATPGHGAEQIAAALNVSTKELALPIRKLLNAGQIRTEGQKRGTRYYPVDGAAKPAEEPKRKRHPRIHAIPNDPEPVETEQTGSAPEHMVEAANAIEQAAAE
jgi:hypothetical protein